MNLAIDARMIDASGIGRYLSHLLKELSTRKLDRCTLIGDPQKLAPYLTAHWNIVEFRAPFYSPWQSLTFPRLDKVDVMYHPHINAPFMRKLGRKTVVTVHDLFYLNPASEIRGAKRAYMYCMYRNALAKADVVLPASYSTLDQLTQMFGDEVAAKCKVAYPTLDPSSLLSPTLDENDDGVAKLLRDHVQAKKVLFVGNVKPHKNLLRLVEAMNNPELASARLFVVGKRDGFITSISMEEQKLLESERIIFTGHLSDRELGRMYAAADLFVFPSLYEGFGYPPLEAMACGAPVAAADIAAVREVCGDAVDYFDPHSIDSIAETIARCLDRSSRATVNASAMLNRFSPANTAQLQADAILGVCE